MKKVAVETIKQIISKETKGTITYKQDDIEFEIEVKKFIGVADKMTLVTDIVETSFDESTYGESLFGIVMNMKFLNHFTNINMPKDLDACKAIVDNKAFMECVIKGVGVEIYQDIAYSAKQALEKRVKAYISEKNGLNEISKSISSLLGNLSKAIQNFDLEKVMSELKNTDGKNLGFFKGIAEQFEEAEATGDYSKLIGEQKDK